MLEVALHALLQGTPIHRYWWAATVALVTIVYHTLVALFNPFDTHGDTYGSFNMLAGSFKSGMISLFRFPVFGKYQIDSLTFKVSLKFSWMWKVKVLLVVEHLSLDIRIADYFGTSIQSVGESNPKSGARKRSNNGILEVIRRFLAYIASVSIEIKSMNIAFNDDWRISVKETGAILGMPVSDESLKLDMFLQQLTVLCLTPTLHSVESTDSLDGTSSILSLPLLRIATLQSTVALPARDGSATMTVTTDDVSVCISPVHQEILTSTFVQIVNTISPHTDTYNNSKRFELLMATFGKIEEQSLRFQILIRDIPNIAHATAGDLSVLYESVAAVPDENELVFYDAEDTPMSTLKTGEPMHCKISVGHVTLWICANEATQPVQILRLAECAFEQQLPSTNANSATAQLMTTLSVQSLLSNAVVPLPQCLDGSFPAILQDTRPANAGASSFSSAAAASPWLSMRCAVVPDESQNAAASSSLASSACKKMDIDCAVSPFALPISLSALGTTLCSVTETFAAFSCLARHNKVGGLDRDCATNGLRVTAAAATSLGAINLSIPFADFRVTYPPALVEMCTTTAGTTSASADEQAVHVGHSSVGILIALRDLKVYNLYTAWQPIEQVFLSLTSLQAQCISADPIRGGSIPRRPFLDISSVNLSQIFSAAPPEESRPTAAAVTIAAPGLTSAVAYDQWAAVELSQLTDSGARFSSEVSLQVDKVSCSLALADMHALGVITGVLSTSSRLYQPLQHFHPSPIVLLDTHNCASYKVYAVVVSANVELVWTQAADTVVYSVLRNTQMSYSQQGLGGMYSRSRLYLHDEVIIHRVKYSLEETVNSVELLRITDPSVVRNKANGGAKAAVEEGPWEEGEVVRRSISEPASLKFTGISGRRLCLFSSKTTPNECFRAETSKSSCVALGVLGTFSNTALPSVLASLDIRYLDEMLQLVRTKTLGARTGTSFALRCASNPICPDSADSAWQNEYLMQVTSPTSITAVHLNSLKVTMQHELEPVLSLTAKSTDLHLMQFGPTLSQTAVVAHSLMLFELTAKYAVHTCIVGDISPSMPNRVELHVSCKDGEYSLMEAQLEQARVMYLQRSVMTLVSYLRDHFIAGLYTKLSVPEIPSDAPSPVPIPVWAPAPPPGRGIFRLAVKVQKSEAHIPMSSCSTDALVIVIDNGLLYRSYMGMTEEATAYCKGPLLRRKQWISEIKNSRRVIFLLFAEHAETVVLNTSINANLSGMNAQAVATPAGAGAGFAGGSALSQLFSPQQAVAPAPLENGTAGNISNSVAAAYTAVKWALPQVAAEALVPSAEISLNDDKELCLEFSVFNSVICSWCDANAVTDDITVHGSYVLAPLPPGPDGAYRSNMLIDISAAEVDWTLAQGQYLAIINLIQQNFCELQELVPEMYPLPPSKTVHLTEQIYGKYGLEADLPILSTVPIHIHKGKISAVESTPQYFSLFCVPLPPPHYPYGVDGHWIRPSTSVVNVEEVAFADTVPVYTKHTTHRDKLFAKMSAQAAARGERGANNQKKTSKSRQQTEVETGESIIGVLFEKLEVDFFRKHEGGGNGIEVSAGTFVIVGIEDRNPDDEDAASVRSVNLDELSLDSIIFAPRCLPLLNSGGNRTMFGSTKAAAGGDSNNLRFQSSNDDARAQIDPRAPLVNPSAVGGATASAEASVSVPHISYSQQGTGNLRRCIVTIADSMAVANIAKVLHTVEYFLQPVDVNTHRNLYCIAESHLGPYDYKIALDMEVHVSNTVVCLTNISRRDGANALCFQVNLDYVQAWRGFLSSGPGKIGLNIDVSVMNIYIAPMREINSSRIQSLVDPCVLVVGQDMMVCPPVEHLQHNLALLTPWMHLEKWAYRPNRTDTPNISRVVKFKVAPASSAANLGAARTAAAAPSASVSPQSRKKRRGKKAAVKRSRSEGDEASHVPHSASGDTAQDVPIDSESADKGTQREDGYESSSEDSASGDEDATVDVDDGDDDDEYSPRSGDAYYSGAESANVPTVHVRISMKDIFFISNAVKQARSALKKRLVVTANAQDYFAESKEMLQDIAHLPKLTYYLEHTSLLNPGKKNKNNELLAEICDFEAILRNNTYNLNILRFNVFDNCMLYTRSPEQLHMASGSACAMWTYNEATDMWEPLIEPINLRAIGATDESIQAAGLPGSATDGTKRKGAKVRVEVVTDPLEINAPQTALGHLIRKLSLADVVTTSSIHLPPYKVINELGVDVKFSIGMGDSVITENEILAGKSIPVEVQQLSEALDAFKLRRQFTVSAPVTSDSTSHKEYVMGISFPNFRDVYQSRAALPIDKVGVHTYEMFSTGQKVADPSGSGEVQFDKRRISMGGLGSAGMGVAAAIATAAAAAARARVPERRPATKDVVAFELAAERTSSEILIAADKTSSEILIAAESPIVPSATSPQTSPARPLPALPILPAAAEGSKEEGALLLRSTSLDFEKEKGENLEEDNGFDQLNSPRNPPMSVPATPSRVSSMSNTPNPGPCTPVAAAAVAATSPVPPSSPARPISLRRTNTTSSSVPPDPIKFVQEVPLAIMEMRIKADGVREILLRSFLSFKNNTTRVFQMSVRLYGSSVEMSLAPGQEWFVPVRFVNPKSSLFIRLDERANWFEALSSMQGLIVQGYWGDPSRLRAHLCACPSETPEASGGGNGWILLIKPEVKDAKAHLAGSNTKTFIPVRYPTKEAYMKTLKDGINSLDVNSSGSTGPSGSSGPTLKSRGANAQPLCIQLLAPLQLCNLLPQALLYRLADAEGLITSEGTLLPGEMVDVHSVFKLFASRIFISVRMLNYCWSKWNLVFSRTSPYSTTERSTDLTLTSMNFMHQSKELTLPTVDLSMVMKENLVRFSCTVLISNRTGMDLELCESSATENFVLHRSRTAAEAFLPVLGNLHAHQHRRKGRTDAQAGGEDSLVLHGRPSFQHKGRDSSDFGTGRSRRQYSREKQNAVLEVGDILEEEEDDSGSSTSCDSELENMSGSDFDEMNDEMEDSIAFENRISADSELENDSAGEEQERRDRTGDDNSGSPRRSLKVVIMKQGRFSQKSGKLTPHQRRRTQLTAPYSPFSPFSASAVFDSTVFTTPGTGAMAAAAATATASSNAPSAPKGGKIVILTVHFPFDHLRQVEVVASADWTLMDVFLRLKQRLAASTVHQTSSNYVFFPWENGKLGPRKVDNSLIIEAQQQYDAANNEGSATSVKIVRGGPDGSNGGNGGSSETASGAPTGSSAAPSSAPTMSMRERPISSMFSRERSLSTAQPAGRKGLIDAEIPEPMQYEMLADCSLTPLAMSTKVDTLKIVRLRLCHVNEWEIYKQIKSIKTEVVEKEGMFSAMFSRAKCTHYATLAPFEGDIPFKPHRMLGFSPCLSLRVPSASTEWSDAVDLIKADFDSSELAITTSSRAGFVTTGSVSGRTINAKAMAAAASAMMAANAPSSVFYEFGAYIERGRGFLQNITTVTLVPKHIVVSKLSMPIQIKQIFPSTECEPLTLQPGSLCSYHFPSRSKSKLLHIRRGSQVLQADGTASGNEGDWQAEIDICKLGVLYAKLRDPLQIIKVQIDTVGASMVATLTEQSTLWPPYRIDNMTEMEIRFRQITSPGAAGAAFGQFSGPSPVGGMLSRKNTVVEGAVKKAAGEVDSDVPITAATATQQSLGTEDSAGGKSTTSSTAGGSSVVPWDYLEKQNSAPYAWDLPFSGRKTIQLEVRQLSTSWVPCEVNLDDNDKLPPLIVKKAAPSLGNPFAEGFLLKQDATGDNWTKVYCILRPDVLYIYPDESRDYLLDVINLSHGATTSTATVSGEAAQFAFVSRFVDKKWMGSTMGYFMSSTAAAKSKAVDINKARCMILKLAEGMGLFANVTELSFRKETSDSESDGGGGGGGEGDSAKERISTASQSTYSPSKRLSSTASADLISESLAKVTFDVGAAEDSTERKDSVDALEDRDTFSDMPNTGGRECNDLQIDETSSSPSRESIASVRRARFSSAPGSTLLSLLTAGVSTEELLEEASNIPLRAMDVVEALLTTKYVDRLDKAKEMCEWMLSEGLLKPRTASKAIDGSGGGVAMFGDDLENGDADADHDSDVDPEELGDRFTIAEPLKISASPSAAGLCEAAVVASSAPSSRLSMSKQVSRTLSTRLSVSGDDTSAAAAEVAGSHRSIAMSMSRRKQSLLKRYADVDLFMCPPTLNPEMMAMLDQANRDSDAQSNPASSSAGVGSNTAVDSNEVFGFTIAMEAKKYNFKCSSEMEFFGWIQACRQSIELLWVDHFLGRRADKKAVALEDYQASIILRLRADGSTKVLEVMQDDERIAKEVKKKNPRRSGKNARQSVSSSQAFSRLSKAIRNSHLAPSLVSEVELKEFNPDKELISVLFTVQSVALSIINAEPAEMLYLSLSGIEMTVERSIDLVKFSVTVQEIQLSNQLLNPEFPVALFPRRIREGQARRLMLPGLNPDRKTYPSLHLYIQQRYHTSLSDVANPGAADSFEEDSHLHYFEMFSLWISPMQLDVDEEIIVKCIRYIRGLKDVVYNPNLGRVGTEFTEELISLQQLGSKSWEGQINRRAVFELYMKLLDSGKEPYLTYNPSAKSSSGIYLSLLQLHPIDLVMSFRPSPNLTVTNSELAMISIISQLDSARLCLNALIAEHAFGSPAIIGEVLLKHYKNAFWRQFHKLIGASDLVEGSVGLVANLGSGVYDLFYEPIDGLMDENGSFLNGLSKGGISLASRTIGGTSAFTSQITGGLGKGVSLLTLDSQFQRNRAYRRFNKTSSMSEGIYVGTQELGKNIVEGVTGIVVSPYRGWETGGGVGFGMGIAKGILGVALKPAVGVFDLASRATEGLRNTAFSGDPDLLDDRFGTFRKRIPRAFGRNGQIALYDAKAAAAQYVADHMTFFQPDPRMLVVHHLYIRRKLEKFTVPGLQVPDEVAEIEVPKSEAWGFPLNKTYLVLVGHNRITLAELSSPEKANSSKKGIKKRASRPRKFIWSCPANCIDQLFSDPHGDLILSISNSALISGAWNSPVPTVLDNLSQNFLIFQSLLEQTIGFKRARKQPLNPTEGLIQSDIRKRYSSGIKSYLMSPSNHTYRLNGHVLYEYSDSNSKKQAMKAEANSTASAEGLESSEKIAGSAGPVDTVDTATTKSEYYIDQLISRIFPTDTPSSTTNINNSTTTAAAKAKLPGEAVLDDMYMSFIYPLVGLYIAGPTAEEGGKFFSITLSRLDGQKMRVLKADEDQEHLSEYLKTNLSLIFAKAEDAQHWRRNLEDAMLWNIEEDEVVEAGPLTTEERRKQSRTIMAMARGAEEVIPPPDDSILGMLVLPTSGCKAEQTEMIKIEIAKTLSATRWR